MFNRIMATEPYIAGEPFTDGPLVASERSTGRFVVIHPLDDLPEEKCAIESLGHIRMTAGVKWSLFALRAYLVLMVVLVFYRFLASAKIL
ncbi:MAG TPA: hypothetical protein VJX67_22025 [Blastocatellia bacterium]|nr:hypothetical protein [Blastocatellia bacterium]